MFIKQFDHPYLKKVQNLDVYDDESKRDLIKNLIFQTIKERVLVHLFLILITFGYHYLKLQMKTTQALEEALSARKLNTLLSLKQQETQKELSSPSFKQIYSKRELEHLKCHPVTEYQLLKVLYFHRPPLKYKKIWQSLFHSTSDSASHDIDSINLYYDRLTSGHAIPHEEILKHLKKKIKGRSTPSLSAQELQLAFKELMDSQEAS